MNKKNKKTFVVGDPIDHSRSPLIHQHWLAIHNIEATYEKIAITKKQFPNFLQNIKNEYLGGNITLPHKTTAFQLVDETDAAAKKIGAVNTIWCKENKLFAANSDVYGFINNLDNSHKNWRNKNNLSRPVLVIGAGGVGRATIAALQQSGFEKIIISNRSHNKAVALAKHFKCQSTKWQQVPKNVGIIINSTSVGMGGDKTKLIDMKNIPSDCLIVDNVYAPLQTNFLTEAKKNNLTTIDGLGMLLHQAVLGFEKWFDVRPEVTKELRRILLRDLGFEPILKQTKFLGITGAIGTGKTTTANMFAELGIPVCNFDEIVHNIYEGEAVPLVKNIFPQAIIKNKVSRKKLSEIIVGDKSKLQKLETILKPLLKKYRQKFKQRVIKEKAPLAIFDMPLLFEQKLNTEMDAVLVTTASPQVQQTRVLSRPNMTMEKFKTLAARQWSGEKKRTQADFIIDTCQTFDKVKQQVKKIAKQFNGA